MTLIKKIIGLFLIFIGGLLFIVTYGTLLEAVISYIKASTNEDFWYLIAFIVLVFFLTIIIIYMIRFGLKLIKRKAIPEDSIDDIGS
ncbi:putative superfamily III holin-X [Flavobacterium sp. 9]|nr:putative superfamily III holin-X [Flavobacterium sp. 9]